MSEVKETKRPKTTKEKVIFGLRIAGNVLFYAVIIFLFLFSIMNINAGGKGGIPNIFGKGILSVQSDSMTNVGTLPDYYEEYDIKQFKYGDLVSVKILNSKTRNKLKVGDVVTFWDDTLKGGAFNTHRIVYITYNEDKSIKSISCQGDYSVSTNNLVYNPTNQEKLPQMNHLQSSGEVQTFAGDTLKQVKAVVTDVHKGAGKVLDNIQKNWLFYFVIPVLALLLFEVFMVVKNIMDLKGEKQKVALASDKEAMMAEIEAEKEKMRQELLAELRAAQQAQPKEEPKVEEVQEMVEEPVQEEPQAEETVEPQEEETTETLEEVTEEEVKTE